MKKISLILICFLMLFFITSCDFLSLLDYIPSSSSSDEKASESSLGEKSSEKDPSHEHEYEKEIISATCENDGYTKHQCECGYYFFDEITKKTEHNYVNAVCEKCNGVDYKELVNIVSTETIKSTFGITVEYGAGFFNQTVAYSSGSGAIIKQEGNKYYIITNNHVVYNKELDEQTTHKTYYVIDYIGNEYRAELIARKAEYDLAILCFSSDERFPVLKIEKENPKVDSELISIGYPNGQANTITLGAIERYQRVNMGDASEAAIDFETIQHDAYINDGSSGGVILDISLNIIGVNFAGNKNDDGEHVSSFAIPIEQVYNFFEEVEFSLE